MILHGDLFDVLPTLDADSLDACVCDPPYGLEFMGKDWDAPWKGDTRQPGDETFTPGSGPFARAKVRHGGSPAYGWTHKFSQMGIAGHHQPLPSVKSTRNRVCLTCHKQERGTKKCQCNEPEWDEMPVDHQRRLQHWHEAWATEVYRVLKPGAHLVAFGGTRTYHRLTCALEDAGFEIRDCLMWLYGSGFPKSLDVSKAIDELAGAQRGSDYVPNGLNQTHGKGWGGGRTTMADPPVTAEAVQWTGWGTALKPGYEPIVLARKPLASTVAKNVLQYGTGAINIDGSRISVGDEVLSTPQSDPGKRSGLWVTDSGLTGKDSDSFQAMQRESIQRTMDLGRWPSNVVLSHTPECRQVCTPDCPVEMLNEQSGVTESTGGEPLSGEQSRYGIYGSRQRERTGREVGKGDVGGASRFVTITKPDEWACAPDCPVSMLDEQSGELTSGQLLTHHKRSGDQQIGTFGIRDRTGEPCNFGGDTGGASRFTTVLKAETWECAPDCPIAMVDDQSGERPTGDIHGGSGRRRVADGGMSVGVPEGAEHRGDEGGASRFMTRLDGPDPGPRFRYEAKPSRGERDRGCYGLEAQSAAEITGREAGSPGLQNPRSGVRAGSQHRDAKARVAHNTHPTVKSVDLMRWLVRLVTPPDGTVLDCFAGSGTTGMACAYEGFKFVGVERDAAYVAIAERRIASVLPLFSLD